MNKQDFALIPPKFLYKASDEFTPDKRLWQSAPSAAMTEKGRVFCVYSADNKSKGETPTNYTVCTYSDDGENFKLVFYAYHEYYVRMSETLLFMSPDGILYHYWTQNYEYFDGRGGIWCAVCEEPDAEVPRFGEPKRICDGCMADNPVILRDGRWLFPASVWTHMESEWHPLPEYEKASVWESRDCGKTLIYLGGAVDPEPNYTENTVFERADGKLVMLLRTKENLGRCISEDGGRTWSEISEFRINTPLGESYDTVEARFMVARFPTGTLLLVTHYRSENRERTHLTALISDDDGETFGSPLLLDVRKVSYPSGNITKDGRVILAYDRGRTTTKEILIASFTEDDIRKGTFGDGSYTKKIVCIGGKNSVGV